MKYLVMECHPAYAVVLDENGRFLKAANLRYAVGDTVTDVLLQQDPAVESIDVLRDRSEDLRKTSKPSVGRKQIISVISIAACFCMLLVFVWQFFLTPYGSVRIQINPQVEFTVNRLNRVLTLTDLNEDGKMLIENYAYRWKTVEQVTEELADRSVEMGYLKNGGTIHVAVESSHEEWKKETQRRLLTDLSLHMGKEISVITEEESRDNDTPGPEAEIDDSAGIPPEKRTSGKQASAVTGKSDRDDKDDEDDPDDDVNDRDDEEDDDLDDVDNDREDQDENTPADVDDRDDGEDDDEEMDDEDVIKQSPSADAQKQPSVQDDGESDDVEDDEEEDEKDEEDDDD